jgi:hypothetical protein
MRVDEASVEMRVYEASVEISLGFSVTTFHSNQHKMPVTEQSDYISMYPWYFVWTCLPSGTDIA